MARSAFKLANIEKGLYNRKLEKEEEEKEKTIVNPASSAARDKLNLCYT
jgi:hypothetical protein